MTYMGLASTTLGLNSSRRTKSWAHQEGEIHLQNLTLKPKKKKSVTTQAVGGNKDLTAVGSAQDAKQKLMAQQGNDMNKLLGTEYIIEKVLKMLDCDPWDDLGNWPPDAFIYKGMQLSNSKMLNEVANREPRTVGSDGKVAEFGVLSTNLG